jgi:hypothetical protein
MKTGKEPMRTFGDLLQFYQHTTVASNDGQAPAAASEPPTKEEPAGVANDMPTVAKETPAAGEQESV